MVDIKHSIEEVTQSNLLVENSFNTIFELAQDLNDQEYNISSAMSEQHNAGKEVLEAVKHRDELTVKVQSDAKDVLENARSVLDHIEKMELMTHLVRSSMNDISQLTQQVKQTSISVDSGIANNERSINQLMSGMSGFKV